LLSTGAGVQNFVVPVEHINPPGSPSVEGISQISIARGSRLAFFSGQVGRLGDGSPAGQDLRSQTAQALRNLEVLGNVINVTAEDIAKVTILVKDYDPSKFEEFMAGFGDYVEEGGRLGTVPSASTLVGVTSLYEPWCLVEIEAIAVLP
jgi:enamine deaminase RidA (YjgF/YER057c/UK114 family)